VLIPAGPRVGSLGAKSFPCSSRQHGKFMRSIRAVLGNSDKPEGGYDLDTAARRRRLRR
jgi:hypothetical protein